MAAVAAGRSVSSPKIIDAIRNYMPQHALFIDSRKRDTGRYPDPNSYVVDFEDYFKNVQSVELVHAVYPRLGTEYIVNLFIDELNSRMYSNCDSITDSFAQLPLTEPLNVYHGGTLHFRSRKTFRVPLEKLTRLTIRFTDVDGAPYAMLDHQMRFVVTTADRHSAIDTGYVERLAEPMGPGAAILGLGSMYTENDLHNAYTNKCQMYLAEQRSSAELEQLTAVYQRLLRGMGRRC